MAPRQSSSDPSPDSDGPLTTAAPAEAETVSQIRATVDSLCVQVAQLRELNALEHVVANGLQNLSALIEPLRDLAPRRVPMPPRTLHRLAVLRRALDRVEWDDVEPPGQGRPGSPRPYDPSSRSGTAL
jgi:hypothetical protein